MKIKRFKIGLLSVIFLFCSAFCIHAEEIRVIPSGKTVGIKLYTKGLLVVGTADVNGENLAEKYGIKINDIIVKVNGEEASSCENFAKAINENPNGLVLSVERDDQVSEINAVPALTNNSVYRLGLWVRDSTAGIGTVTYYDSASKSFAALGHAINDTDTDSILSVKSGNILNCSILSVTKSKIGSPGEINAAFDGISIGNILINSQVGIFGKYTSDDLLNSDRSVPVAARDEIHNGDAYILSDVCGDEVKQYSVKITDITDDADKGLVLKITDDTLVDLSGGIVRGMSGSPIIQDGKLIGAVTHVFVGNPKKGYGALAENMIDMTNKLDSA